MAKGKLISRVTLQSAIHYRSALGVTVPQRFKFIFIIGESEMADRDLLLRRCGCGRVYN